MENDSWTKTLVPGGARGVALKLKFLLMAAWAESLGFVREDRSRLRVITAWGMRRSQSWEENLVLQEASPTQKRFLNVWIARSAALRNWMYGGKVGSQRCICGRIFCIVWEQSLSRMWIVGAALCYCSCLWHVVQAAVISRACRFLRRLVWMELVSPL